MKIVCIDSMLFVWGIRKESSQGQEAMIERAESFFEYLEKDKSTILLPTPILSEILRPVPIDSDKYNRILDIINEKFMVAPFDAIAAVKCAEITQKKIIDTDIKALLDQNFLNKRKIKFDAMIIPRVYI